jgi:hypothetical protein
MGPQLLLDTSHLMQHVEALGMSIEAHANAEPVARQERVVAEYIQRRSGQIIELGVALGCAAFAMGFVIGVYLLIVRP